MRELLVGHRHGTQLARRTQARISPIIDGLVARAQEQGRLNRTVGKTDVAMIPIMVGAIIQATDDVDPGQWRRWLAILLEGVASGPRLESFPGGPPTTEQVERIIAGGETFGGGVSRREAGRQ